MPKLTKTFVEKTSPGDRDVLVWDSALPGFGLRVKPSGRRSYLIQYRNAQGRSRRLTVGLHGRLTAEEARQQARKLLAKVELGEDPAELRQTVRAAPTMADLAARYLTEHAELKKKPSSVLEDRRLLERHIFPAFGHRAVTDVTRAEIATLHAQIGAKTPTTANRVIALLSKMFNLAELWGLRPDYSNPCRHITRFKERRRERYLSSVELARLHHVLDEAERTGSELPEAITAIRLLIFTGCRLGEIRSLRWDEVDIERQCLLLADSKTGRKTVYLNEPALRLLTSLEPTESNPYVLPGRRPGQHFVNIKDPWGRLRALADLDDVRLHDLRHTFASIGVAAGISLPIIGKMLGHTQPATTQRYAHLAAEPVRRAAAMIGANIEAAFAGEMPKDPIGSRPS